MSDTETADQVKRLRIKANMLRMGERIAFGSDSYALECAADTIERLMRERDEARALQRPSVSSLDEDQAEDAIVNESRSIARLCADSIDPDLLREDRDERRRLAREDGR